MTPSVLVLSWRQLIALLWYASTTTVGFSTPRPRHPPLSQGSLFRERRRSGPPPSPPPTTTTTSNDDGTHSRVSSSSSTRLWGGQGIAAGYTWKEEAFELDVTVKVPKDTRARDVQFRATTKSIDLRVTPRTSSADRDETKVLLDGNRTLRGRVSLDGTYWVISDVQRTTEVALASDYREITVTIEKHHKAPANDFAVVEYDWKGVYADDAEEVVLRRYDEPEELDIHEYAAQMGVDLDNLNMSMVDKTMFSSGLNLTQSSLDELTKAGFMTEVTQQKDGTEYASVPSRNNKKDDASPPPMERFSPLGETVSDEEWKQLDTSAKTTKSPSQIPFLDTNSPWHKTVPVKVSTDAASNQTTVQLARNFTRAAFAEERQQQPSSSTDDAPGDPRTAADPIDLLTVKKLKEILKSQGLKVSGNKKELQERLRNQVNSLLQGKQE